MACPHGYPRYLNPAIANPAIANPAIANPAIANPAIANQTVTDASYTITNNGNTVGSYAVKLFGTQPAGASLQLILSKLYATPTSQNCQLVPQVRNVVLVSIRDPVLEGAGQLGDPEIPNSSTKNATLNLRPGETGVVTLRSNVASAAALQEIVNNVTPVIVSHAANTGATTPPATLAITTANGPLPAGIVGVTYTAALASFGGNAPSAWAVVGGSLPPGLTLDSITGIISGTPAASGLFSFSVSLTDSSVPAPTVAVRNLSINIAVPLVIGTATLADGVVGIPYSQTLTATGGDSNFAWSLSSGALPAGLTLNASGVINGTPLSATSGGSFVVEVKDTGTPQQTKAQTLSIRVATPLIITNSATLPDAIVGVPYSATLQTNGGTAAVSWLVIAGAPPAGLSLSSAGVISGTPTASNTLGATFTVQGTDSGTPPQSATRSITLRVAAPLTITTAALAAPKYGVAYNQTLTAGGGITPLTWSLAAGSGPLPGGLILSSAGVLSGTPTALGTFAFTVRVADAGVPQQVSTRSLTLTVTALYTVSFYVQPSLSSPGKQITPSIKVLVTDAQGKGVSGVMVTLAIANNPGGAVLSGTTTAVTGNNGIAIFASNSLNKTGTGYTLQATANLAGAGVAISIPFDIR